MTSRFREADLSKIKAVPIADRESKVRVDDILDPDRTVPADVPSMFPGVLKGREFRMLVDAMRTARERQRPLLWMLGAHVLKCGLSLYVNRLMEKGYVTGVATTGSATVHDMELSFFGHTSEDVAVELPEGRFGMARETASAFADACRVAAAEELGLGEGIGRYITERGAPHRESSVFAAAYAHGIPATVHVAMGTDITHQHPVFSGGDVGELSMRDFRILTAFVGDLFDGGVCVLFGSAVVIPEVFLKAVSVNYNLGLTPNNVTAASFDMLSQYRVRENVLGRPFHGAGRSHSFTGHHEIMLPLLYHSLVRE